MPKGYLKIIEQVPIQFVRRAGDWSQEGGNNTLIVLGTDRAAPEGPASLNDGFGTVEAEGGGKETGTAMIVVGRKDMVGGNPDINADDAVIYLSQKTDADNNLGTTFETTDKGAAVISVSDFLRYVFRQNLKIASQVSSSWIFFDGDKIHINLQDKVKVLLDAQGDASSAEINVQDNFVKVTSDGVVTIDSKSQVIVNTKDAQVNCDTAEVSAKTSVTIDSPDTTVTQKLHVGGAADFGATVDVAGVTSIAAVLNVAAAANVGGVVATGGGITGAGGGPIPGDVKAVGDVQAAGGSASLSQHTHMVPGVEGGPDIATTLNIAQSTAKAAEIAAAQAAAEAARKAAEEEAARQAAAEEAARKAAEASVASGEQPPPDYSV